MTLPTLSLDILHCIHKACDFRTRRVFQEALGWQKKPPRFCPILSKEVEFCLRYPKKSKYDSELNCIVRIWGTKEKPSKYLHTVRFAGQLRWEKQESQWIIPPSPPGVKSAIIIEKMERWSNEQRRYDVLFYSHHINGPLLSMVQDSFTRAMPGAFDGKPLYEHTYRNIWNGDLEVDVVHKCKICNKIMIGKFFFVTTDAMVGAMRKSGRYTIISSVTGEKTRYGLPGYGGGPFADRRASFLSMGIYGPQSEAPIGVSCFHRGMGE